MKKIVFVLTILLLAWPALAKVEITCDTDGAVVSVYYASVGDANLPRAFGLNIELSNDANIVSAGNFNPAFNICPGSFDYNETTGQIYGSPIASEANYPGVTLEGPPDGNGMTIEMGSLHYPPEANSPNAPEPNGLLFTFTVDADCNVAISGNTARGNVVLYNADEDNTDYGSGCTVTLVAGCCPGDCEPDDGVGDGDIDLDDYSKLKSKLLKAKYYSGDYYITPDHADPNVAALWSPCADWQVDTDIDLDDYSKMKSALLKAKYYSGDYYISPDHADPNVAALWPCP